MQKWYDKVVCIAMYVRQDPKKYSSLWDVKEAIELEEYNLFGLPKISTYSMAELIWAISKRSFVGEE
jgi:hypothetical protein